MERTTASAVPQTAICSVDEHFGEVILPLAEIRREEVGGESRHVAAVFNQRERGHFRALPRDDQHGEYNGPAQNENQLRLGGAMVMVCMFGSVIVCTIGSLAPSGRGLG
ncbi:Uncharacterised protein [Escherichia coli]|nr:Uncharacterised protein [Escherichia coli]